MTDYRHILIDIARGYDPQENYVATGCDVDITQHNVLQQPAGPSQWDYVRNDPSAYGPEEDFFIHRDGAKTILCPTSKAALHWCYSHLPEDCPRWGATGFIIDTDLERIVAHMKRDRLMDRQDYEDAMEEAHNLSRQWED